MLPTWLVILFCVVGAIFVAILWKYFSLWLQGFVSGARIGLFQLFLMSLRNVNPRIIMQCRVMAVQAGIDDIPTQAMEAQHLAGGDVLRLTLALIAANRAGISLDWETAAAIDLAGRDVLEAVRVSVNPKVIRCPDPEVADQDTLDGVAKDGIQLKVRVLVTVRTNLLQLIGGATETTVIARVGQGIVSAIGSCETYQDALTDPMAISREVLAKGLDSQTAFAIVSIDIADIDVGSNIGASLQIDQANADIRIARAAAEKRRAMAVAYEQEMRSLTQENKAKVVLAEAKIPKAIAESYRSGQLTTEVRRLQLPYRRHLPARNPENQRFLKAPGS
ncbi:SigmaW regulon antibacterial [Thalassoglobus neptunius]|uniref:SigmaW regulon antibacterial n=1 Tax=Thalassoglobus neptunius TaxID=1938619 RepID=A0A5C5VAV1_9PLAN|nr:flotillin-like protein FloA [Thalassoglobus neptunius]TWT35077.1 SigmaW regulon antibacterial [Thalassoglobus neptunius]